MRKSHVMMEYGNANTGVQHANYTGDTRRLGAQHASRTGKTNQAGGGHCIVSCRENIRRVRACEFAGVDRYRFYEECAKRDIPVVNYDPGELEAELEYLRGL